MEKSVFGDEFDLKKQTSYAILLQFKTIQVSDLAIPDATDIKRLVTISGRLMNGEEIKPEEITCVTSNPRYNSAQYWKKGKFFLSLSPRVPEGIEKIFDESSNSSGNSFLELIMGIPDRTLANEWNYGYGTWYRFREGKREKVEQEVKQYFSGQELNDFDEIGNLFQSFIMRVGASHPPRRI
ncbi:Uncharacterised protein [uncultured archaeon]|nr:Uncharacterised protein [uncultured archaeon]